MRRAILQISDQLIAEICKGCKFGFEGYFAVIKNGLPEDAKAVYVIRINEYSIGIVLESSFFEDIEEGKRYPLLDPVIVEARMTATKQPLKP